MRCLLLNLASFFCIGMVFSQDSILTLYKTNPLRPLMGQVPFTGEYSISFEKVLDKRFSYQLAFSVVAPSPLNRIGIPDNSSNLKEINIVGSRIKPSLRFYFFRQSEPAPIGLYWGPMASFNFVRFADRGTQEDYLHHYYTSFNLLLGYQLLVFKGFYLDLFSGVGYKYNFWKRAISFGSIFDLPAPVQGLKYTLGFEFGVAGRKYGN